MDDERISCEVGISGEAGQQGELALTNAEGIAPVFRRAINDRPPFHVNPIGQLLVALDAP
jgi:hypothetical protein